jgi:hypothetical protein
MTTADASNPGPTFSTKDGLAWPCSSCRGRPERPVVGPGRTLIVLRSFPYIRGRQPFVERFKTSDLPRHRRSDSGAIASTGRATQRFDALHGHPLIRSFRLTAKGLALRSCVVVLFRFAAGMTTESILERITRKPFRPIALRFGRDSVIGSYNRKLCMTG